MSNKYQYVAKQIVQAIESGEDGGTSGIADFLEREFSATAEADLAKAREKLEEEQRAMEVVVAENSHAKSVIERLDTAGTALLMKASPAETSEPTSLIPNRNLKSLGEAIQTARKFMEGK